MIIVWILLGIVVLYGLLQLGLNVVSKMIRNSQSKNNGK